MVNRRFRNHPSVILEQIGAIGVVVIIIAIQNMSSVYKVFKDGELMDFKMLVIALCLMASVIFSSTVMTLRWAKTWISIDEDTLTIERRTLINKKNNIGIKNISNVNAEQNIFERIIGTSKLKLDTNSLSTANSTDVTIVLKKADADAVRSFLLQRIRELNQAESEGRAEGAGVGGAVGENRKTWTQEIADMENYYDYYASAEDIVMHGIFSINLLSVLIFVGIIVGGVTEIADLGGSTSAVSIGSMLSAVAAGGFIAISSLYSIFKGFISIYGFKAGRREDKIYLSYGLLKKVNYAIPVDKVNALVIKQTLTARIFHRYSAQLVNIGMNDDKENNVCCCMYCRREMLAEVLEQLIPELCTTASADKKGQGCNAEWESGFPGRKISRQPHRVWLLKMVKLAVAAVVLGALLAVYYELTGGLHMWAALLAAGGIFALVLINSIGAYLSWGVSFGSTDMVVSRGVFARSSTLIKYDKIQYTELSQNILAKKLNLVKAEVNILASLGDVSQALPYFETGGAMLEDIDIYEIWN